MWKNYYSPLPQKCRSVHGGRRKGECCALLPSCLLLCTICSCTFDHFSYVVVRISQSHLFSHACVAVVPQHGGLGAGEVNDHRALANIHVHSVVSLRMACPCAIICAMRCILNLNDALAAVVLQTSVYYVRVRV